MRLTKYLVNVDLETENKEWLLINTLYGCVNVLEDKYMKIVDAWKNQDNIVCENEDEKELYDFLDESRYIIENEEDEKKQKEYVLSVLRENHKKRSTEIHTISFVLTYDCNFACPYCYEKGNETNKKIITKEMVDKAFEINKSLKYISFFGGEPFLPSNFEIIKYIISKADKDTTFSAISNGYYLEEMVPILKDVKISPIQITLDGDEAIHNKTRILRNGEKETFQKILNGIDLAINNSIPIKIRMNISKQNMDSCLNIRHKLEDKYNNSELLTFELQPIFQLSAKDKEEIESKIYWEGEIDKFNKPSEVDSELYNNVILKTSSPLLKLFISNANQIYPLYCTCDAEEGSRFYDANGDIYSCILSVGKKEKSIGTYYPEYNIKSDCLINRNIETVEKCKECTLALICGGGCGGAVFDYKNNTCFVPNCAQIKKDLYKTIPKLYRMREKQKKVTVE